MLSMSPQFAYYYRNKARCSEYKRQYRSEHREAYNAYMRDLYHRTDTYQRRHGMKIIAWFGKEPKPYHFANLIEASTFTQISEKRILFCIKSGQRWRAWTFDEE